MVEYSEVNCKLTNVQLNKLKKAVKSNERATLRLGDCNGIRTHNHLVRKQTLNHLKAK